MTQSLNSNWTTIHILCCFWISKNSIAILIRVVAKSPLTGSSKADLQSGPQSSTAVTPVPRGLSGCAPALRTPLPSSLHSDDLADATSHYSLLIISTRSREGFFSRNCIYYHDCRRSGLYLPCTNLRFDEEGLSVIGKGSEVGLLC
jgi:hypothetical protein